MERRLRLDEKKPELTIIKKEIEETHNNFEKKN